MKGQMQNWPLTVNRILEHASRWHGRREVVERAEDGELIRSSYAELHDRARQLSSALQHLGVRFGDRVGTLAWNGLRHLETWYATMGIGAVCHTLNVRLHWDQLVYTINHAADRVLFVERSFLPLIAENRARLPTVEHVVVMSDDAKSPNVIEYDSLIRTSSPACTWGNFDEDTACGLCYTSGTTGNPKGVLYSHRSTYLHTLMTLQADAFGLGACDTVLLLVPMFHATAWGLPFAAPAVGAKLVLPGARLDGSSVFDLMEREEVTFSAAVPTVWQMLLSHLRATGQRLSHLRRAVVGGSACPEGMMRAFRDDYGVEMIHLWGMTEMSPVGTLGVMPAALLNLDHEAQYAALLKQGRAPLGVDMMLTDDDGAPVSHDGRRFGRLKVRGPAVTAAYLSDPPGSALDAEGRFDTGDIATIDEFGLMQITDRAKDIVKSGGEWISSIEIENIVMGLPEVLCAAVVALADPKWGERPLLLIQPATGMHPDIEQVLALLRQKIPKWWIPDIVKVVDAIPLGPTGKIDKKQIRQQLAAPGMAQAD